MGHKKGRRQREGENLADFVFPLRSFQELYASRLRQFISRCDIAGTIIPRVTLIEKWIRLIASNQLIFGMKTFIDVRYWTEKLYKRSRDSFVIRVNYGKLSR